MSQKDDFVIEHAEVTEFEFDTHSVFYLPEEDVWMLETYGDDDEVQRVVIQDTEGTTFSFNKEQFDELGFTETQFNTLVEFLHEKDDRRQKTGQSISPL